MIEKEVWKPIKDYEGIYEVSSLGRVKSLKFNKQRILKAILNKDGYLISNLCVNGKTKMFCNHQLVAMAFLGHEPCGFELVVDHKNDDKIDNRLENLQVVTQRFNIYKTQNNYTSKYKGVSFCKEHNKWRARIEINGKSKHLGRFFTEEEASLAYQNKLKEIL